MLLRLFCFSGKRNIWTEMSSEREIFLNYERRFLSGYWTVSAELLWVRNHFGESVYFKSSKNVCENIVFIFNVLYKSNDWNRWMSRRPMVARAINITILSIPVFSLSNNMSSTLSPSLLFYRSVLIKETNYSISFR